MIEAYRASEINVSGISKILVAFLVGAVYTFIASFNLPGFANSQEASKTIFLLFSSSAILCLISLHLFMVKQRSIKLSILDLLLFTYLFYIIFNRQILQENSGFSIRFLDLLGMYILYIAIRMLSIRNQSLIYIGALIGGVSQAILGLLQYSLVLPSPSRFFPVLGSFSNPGPYAGFLSTIGIIALGFMMYCDRFEQLIITGNKGDKIAKKILRSLPMVAFVLVLVLLPALRSRAAWVALLFGIAVLSSYRYDWIDKYKKIKGKYKTILAGCFLTIISLGAFWIINFKTDSSLGRALIYRGTSEMIKDNFVRGVGFDRFKTYYMNYQADHLKNLNSINVNMLADNTVYAFSEPLQIFAELGIIGFILVLIIGYKCFSVRVSDNLRFLKVINISVLSVLLTFGLFTYVSPVLPVKIFLPLSLAMLASLAPNIILWRTHAVRAALKPILCLIMIGSSFFLFKYSLRLKNGFDLWGDGLKSYSANLYRESTRVFKDAYPLFFNDGEFLMQYGKSLSMAGYHGEAIEILNQSRRLLNNSIIQLALGDSYKYNKMIDLSEKAYQEAILMTPGRILPYYLLMKLYEDSGLIDKAIKIAKKGLALPVKVSSKANDEIRNEMNSLLKNTRINMSSQKERANIKEII